MSASVIDHVDGALREGAFGNATGLVCRECGAGQPLGPFYACQECFGPLEIGYAFPKVTRRHIEAGPKNIWRYQPLLPVPSDIALSPNMEPGFTRLVHAAIHVGPNKVRWRSPAFALGLLILALMWLKLFLHVLTGGLA